MKMRGSFYRKLNVFGSRSFGMPCHLYRSNERFLTFSSIISHYRPQHLVQLDRHVPAGIITTTVFVVDIMENNLITLRIIINNIVY